MSATRPADILKRLDPPAADAELLRRFAAGRDAAAFAELVRRHGPLVLGVCRRVLGDHHAGEDAFQAVFLVLARKAGHIRDGGRLGSFLYGVAYRVAWRARRAARRRRAREVSMANPPDVPAPPSAASADLGPVLDAELSALAACYRDAIVLCDLQGASREQAAAALGVPEGTLSSRLANGRKKLAARLARRGVSLSVAALPLALALAEVRAATHVPNDLQARTCGLVLDHAAGGAVPGPLAHLLNGGSAVRKTFVVCVAALVAVGGAVLAARPGAEPPGQEPPQPHPPPKVVEKPQPKAKEEPNAEPKAVAFTTAPKLQRSLDLDVGGSISVMWNRTGTALAVVGRPNPQPNQKTIPTLALYDLPNDRTLFTQIGGGDELVAVAADGKGFTTALGEFHLISGKHQLKQWAVAELPAGAPGGPGVVIGRDGVSRRIEGGRVTPLDATAPSEYSFAPDGKTYRTVVWNYAPSGAVKSREVVEVDAATGKRTKALFQFDHERFALSPDGQRIAVADKDFNSVVVCAVGGGRQISEHKIVDDPQSAQTPRNVGTPALLFSPDGRRLVLARGIGRTLVLDADTGKALPALEGTERAKLYPDAGCFTGDGRLLVSFGETYRVTTSTRPGPGGKEVKQENWSAGEGVLAVWDTQTGKALKTWKARGVRVAFCPTRPLLAILEGNGETETRVGFWDFDRDAPELSPKP